MALMGIQCWGANVLAEEVAGSSPAFVMLEFNLLAGMSRERAGQVARRFLFSTFNIRCYNISMDSNWVLQRRLKLFIFMLVLIGVFGFYLYKRHEANIVIAPSCKDNIRNQDEGGIDCEGVCKVICREHVAPIKVLYTRAIRTATSTYDLVALLENTNVGKSAGLTPYVIHVYSGVRANTNIDKSEKIEGNGDYGKEIYTYKGKIQIKDAAKVPIIIPNQHIMYGDIGKSNVDSNLTANLELSDMPMYPSAPHIDIVDLKDYSFNKDMNKLTINLRNMTLYTSGKIKVTAIVYVDDNAIAAGYTVDDGLSPKSEKPVYILWNDTLGDIKNYRVEIYIDNIYNE